MHGQSNNLIFLMPVFGALTVLTFYDKYPAKMIWGNVGSMMIGSAIGAYIIITGAELFGIIILIQKILQRRILKILQKVLVKILRVLQVLNRLVHY
jgi:UDP-N-acetylmuramyl pentapeptide phosphotransferase/UDP-N-acetylglucosamine-1-phosphate transferase